MKKRTLIYSLLLLLILSFISCGNSRHRKRNSIENKDSNDIYSGTEQTDYSGNSSHNRKNKTSVEPNSQQIKLDLADRTIVEPTHKLYRSEFKIRSANNVVNVDIQSTEKNGNQIDYQTQLTLSDDINTYIADVNITYSQSAGKWVIQYLESKSLDIVPTKKFNNCIVVKKEVCGFMSTCPYLYNNCDVALLVEGIEHSSYGGDWEYFAKLVPANGSLLFDYDENIDYEIKRIERP
jgi:hypothetical protein